MVLIDGEVLHFAQKLLIVFAENSSLRRYYHQVPPQRWHPEGKLSFSRMDTKYFSLLHSLLVF